MFDDRVSEVTCSIGSRVCGSRFSVCACVERGSRNCVHVQVMEMRWELCACAGDGDEVRAVSARDWRREK